jgi:hypothetical protein
LACGRTFGATLGTPLYRLKTDPAEIIRALQVLLHRGSLRAAEEQGPKGAPHNYETIAAWIRRVREHAEAVTKLLVRDLVLSEVEDDEFWSFVGEQGDEARRRGRAILPRPRDEARGGAARARIG